MQKSIKAIAATLVISFLLSGNVLSQDMQTGTTAKAVYKSIPTTENNISVADLTGDVVASNPIIASKFSSLFPLATSAQWASANNDLWVSFLNKGRKATACFNAKGKMNYLISDCGMEQLPAAFSKAITKDYPLYSLFNAIEIKAHDVVAYQVVLENQLNFITLKYTNDGVEELRKVTKTSN